MTYPEIRAALMEILDDKLSIENLKAIKQYVPTGDEVRCPSVQSLPLFQSIIENEACLLTWANWTT